VNPTTPRIAIVGGGLTGLAAAHALVERSHRAFTLFESAPHAGGIVQTRHERGFVLEEGPDSFITDKPEALDLVRRLGLAGEVRGTRPEFRRSFVVHGGRLVPTPDGFYLLAPARLGPVWASPLFSPWGKLRLALEPWVPRARGLDDPAYDESLASFVRRRLGGEVLERIAQAMVGGIYGAAPEELSLAATFPRFLAWEREFGSVTRGLRQQADARAASASGPRYGLFATLANGMQTLTDALIARLPDGALRPLSPVRALDPDPSGGWRVSGEHYDTVILALPAAGAAALVAGFDAALAADLSAYTAGSSVTVSLAYPASAVAHSLDGAGFVVPRGEAAALPKAPRSFACFTATMRSHSTTLTWSRMRTPRLADSSGPRRRPRSATSRAGRAACLVTASVTSRRRPRRLPRPIATPGFTWPATPTAAWACPIASAAANRLRRPRWARVPSRLRRLLPASAIDRNAFRPYPYASRLRQSVPAAAPALERGPPGPPGGPQKPRNL
jgi:oxygen-dependent protoporphyrinogen oxidase